MHRISLSFSALPPHPFVSVPSFFATLLFHDRWVEYLSRTEVERGLSRREAETDCVAKQKRTNEFKELSSRDLTHNQMGILGTIADDRIMANKHNNDGFSFILKLFQKSLIIPSESSHI